MSRVRLTVLAVWVVLSAIMTVPAARVRAATPESPFGINGTSWSHIGANTEEFDWATGIRRLDSLQQMGASWDRCDFWWHRIEPQKGRFIWRDYDRIVDEYTRRGLYLMPILAYDAAWSGDLSPETDEARAEYGRFVYETVRHFKGRIRAYEIWNEPNISIFWRAHPSPAMYAKLLAVAYREAKRADPKVIVVGGAVAGMDFTFIDGLLAAGAGKSMDVISIHPYQGNLGSLGPEAGNLASDLSRLKAMLRKHGVPNLPIWITEMGNRSVPDPSVPKGHLQPTGRVTEQQQANYVARSYANALSEGVSKIFWFNLQDWPEETWGTIAPDFRRKPSWYAYRGMASTLSNLRYSERLKAPASVHAVVFRSMRSPRSMDGERMAVAIWTETPGTTLGLKGLASDATIQQARYGGVAATAAQNLLHTASLRTAVSLNGEPLYITATGRRPLSGAAPIGVTANPPSVTPGERFTLSIRFADPEARAAVAKRTRTLVLFGPDSRKSLKAYLEPVGKETYRVRGTLPPGQYSVGYAWLGPARNGASPPRLETTTRLTVRPALSLSLVPDPSVGRELRLTVTNNSRQPVTATATVDMVGNRTDTVSNIVLPGRQSVALPVSNALPADRPLTVPLPVTARVTSRAGGASWFGNVFFWAAGKSWGPPLVLNSAQVWQSQDGTWTGPEDLSATLRARYDERALYLRAEVTDDIFHQPYQKGEVWRGDAFQIAIDPRWSRRPDAKGATEFALALTPDGPQVYRWTHPAGIIPNADLKVTRDGTRTLYEATIPWKALGISTVRPGQALGFALILNDNDGKDRQGWLMYGDGIATEKRSDRYATLTLLK